MYVEKSEISIWLPSKNMPFVDHSSKNWFNVGIPFMGGICCDLAFKIEILWVGVTLRKHNCTIFNSVLNSISLTVIQSLLRDLILS